MALSAEKQLQKYYLNREAILKKRKDKYAENPEKFKEKSRKARERRSKKEKQEHAAYMQKYVANNYERLRKMANARQQERRKTDPEVRFRMLMSVSIHQKIKKYNSVKAGKTEELLGCTIRQLRHHLEKLFSEGMCWANYGKYGWHIDHIRPCASFDLTDPEQQKACWHYTNLQPMWWHENLSKSAKWNASKPEAFKKDQRTETGRSQLKLFA